jgi:hypothetical protein
MRVYVLCLRWLFTRQKNLSCNFCASETQDENLPCGVIRKTGVSLQATAFHKATLLDVPTITVPAQFFEKVHSGTVKISKCLLGSEFQI